MPTARYIGEAATVADGGPALAEKIRSALTGRPLTSCGGPTRVEIALPQIDPLDWLQAQGNSIRLYWAERDGSFETAAVGAADEIRGDDADDLESVFDRIRAKLTDGPSSCRYFGGHRFDGRPSATRGDEWDVFGFSRFILPRFELTRTGNGAVLACHLVPSDSDDEIDAVIAQAEALHFRKETESPLPRVADRIDEPQLPDWTDMITGALAEISAGKLNKIALARRATFRASGPIDPVKLLGALKRQTADSFRFCLQFSAGSAFLGASPERLYARDGVAIRSEAVAGTRPRSADGREDRRLGRDLLASEKDNREQQIVADHVAGAMAALCDRFSANGAGADKRLLRMARVQHLVNSYCGELRSDATDAAIISRLHPTPAVGGCPSEEAMSAIDRLEPFDRGWYAGPVGWVGASAAEFAVAIRSGLVSGDRLHLYSGAGIVAGSKPPQEWSEIEAKLGGFLAALGVK